MFFVFHRNRFSAAVEDLVEVGQEPSGHFLFCFVVALLRKVPAERLSCFAGATDRLSPRFQEFVLIANDRDSHKPRQNFYVKPFCVDFK